MDVTMKFVECDLCGARTDNYVDGERSSRIRGWAVGQATIGGSPATSYFAFCPKHNLELRPWVIATQHKMFLECRAGTVPNCGWEKESIDKALALFDSLDSQGRVDI